MNKKIKLLFTALVCFFLILCIPGCINQEETLDSTIQSIKDKGTLIVGTSTPYKPMEYTDDNGNVIGFDIDISQKIADHLEVDLKIEDMGFDDLLDAVSNGEIDIAIAAITITNEREEQVAFSNPYLNAGQVIITNESNQDINTPEDLEDKKVGVQNSTTSESEALKYTNSSLVIVYKNYTNAIDDLISGEIHAIIIDYTAGIGLTKDNPDIKIIGDPFTNELYGIALKKGESAFKNEINTVIASGIIDTLEKKWF